jgi:predicted transcriptional regulator
LRPGLMRPVDRTLSLAPRSELAAFHAPEPKSTVEAARKFRIRTERVPQNLGCDKLRSLKNEEVWTMATERSNDLRLFQRFIEEKLATNGANATLEEALVEWEIENQTVQEREETLEAIRRGFADIEAGRVRPAREALEELRFKHNLPPLA